MSVKSEIEAIASVHLGKAGDGSVVKPYVTPDSRDASLLVPIPRNLNRTAYDITDDDFLGHDVWNCYEVSFLAENGYPVSGVMVIEYPSDTPNIVESKSLKLYLNSYNMMKFRADNVTELFWHFEEMVCQDLHNALYKTDASMGSDELMFSPVRARFYPNRQNSNTIEPFKVQFLTIEDIVNVSKITFDVFNEDPNTLIVDDNLSSRVYRYHTSALRSNCRVTNQPDWGDVYIHIKGRETISPESLLKYIVSLRKENHFHEEICEMIYKRIMDKVNPEELFVACLYTRRGGIDINPMRANSEEVFNSIVHDIGLMKKTMRQ